jgi:hypothetical protein
MDGERLSRCSDGNHQVGVDVRLLLSNLQQTIRYRLGYDDGRRGIADPGSGCCYPASFSFSDSTKTDLYNRSEVGIYFGCIMQSTLQDIDA